MPKYICQNCGRIFYGWGVFLIYNLCGGKLERVIEKKEEGEI